MLTKIMMRLAAATPGPWYQGDTDSEGIYSAPGGYIDNLIADSYNEESGNATLIAQAPADLAYLLGVADELRALIEEADSGEWHNSQDCKIEGRQGGADPCLLCAALAKARAILGIAPDDDPEHGLDKRL